MRGTTAKLLRKFTQFHSGAARKYDEKITYKRVAVPKEVHTSGFKNVPRVTVALLKTEPRAKYFKAKELYRQNPANFQRNIFPAFAR